MSRTIFMNDRLVPEEDARVSVFDHGLLYGDGVFEGLRSYSGRVFRLNAITLIDCGRVPELSVLRFQ